MDRWMQEADRSHGVSDRPGVTLPCCTALDLGALAARIRGAATAAAAIHVIESRGNISLDTIRNLNSSDPEAVGGSQ